MMAKIGYYQDGTKYVDVIPLGDSKKNQPRDNSGRYIHGNAVTKHFDTYPEKGHKDYGEMKIPTAPRGGVSYEQGFSKLQIPSERFSNPTTASSVVFATNKDN